MLRQSVSVKIIFPIFSLHDRKFLGHISRVHDVCYGKANISGLFLKLPFQ